MKKFEYRLMIDEPCEQDSVNIDKIKTKEELIEFLTKEHNLINLDESEENRFSFQVDYGCGDVRFGTLDIFESKGV